jgi:hypothetical protein
MAGSIAVLADHFVADKISLQSVNTVPANSFDTLEGSAGSIRLFGFNALGTPSDHIHLRNTTISTTYQTGGPLSEPGTIQTFSRTLSISDGTTISSDTNGSAAAGNILLATSESLEVTDSTVSSNTKTITFQVPREDNALLMEELVT